MKKLPALLIIILLSIQILLVTPVKAAISSCTASVTPTSVDSSTTNDFSFNIVNNDSANSLVWVKITRPSSNFTITGTSSGGGTVTSSDVTFGGAFSLGPSGGQIGLSVTATSGAYGVSSANWTVQASDDSSGASPANCSGDLGTSINGPAAITISNIVVSDVTDSAVKVTWTTDASSNSTVDYGTTSSYGSTKSDSASVTSHSISIDGLSANTTYHYNVKSTDSSGNTAQSGDNTFVTAKSGSTGTTQTGTTITKTTTVTITKIVKDDTPPTISLDTDFDKPFPQPPKITGRATDSGDVNPGINRVEYSIDDGKTYLEVDSIKSPNAKSTTFDFIPAIFEDGNFKIKVRAYDNSGNVTASTSKTLIIDRLPPQIGGILFSIGPQIIQPGENGILHIPQGLDIKITLSEVGGPITVDLLVSRSVIARSETTKQSNSEKEIATGPSDPRNDEGVQAFSLIKNLDNGLWSGTLTFSEPGTYQLTAKSVDGTNNKTERKLNQVVVLESGVVEGKDGKPINNAFVSLYYFEPTTGAFILWDGVPFGQKNSQKVDNDGRYRLLVPPGKYYLQISAPGYKSVKTNIFNLAQTSPINVNFSLERARGIQIGPFFLYWPDFTPQQVDIKLSQPVASQGDALEAQIGKEMPYFLFPGEDQISTNTFKGKATILTFTSTWSPQTAEQLAILETLNRSEINVAVVMIQDTASKVDIFKRKGGYKVPILADPDGVLVQPLGILNLPTHVFLDRKGVVKKIKVGVLTKEELLDNLIN